MLKTIVTAVIKIQIKELVFLCVCAQMKKIVFHRKKDVFLRRKILNEQRFKC